MACASAGFQSEGKLEARWCPDVMVHNEGYFDVRVYVDGVRVGFVTGHTTATFERVCRINHRNMKDIVVDEMARGSHYVRYHGPSPLDDGENLLIVVGSTPAHSWARMY
jgi:hypothetical protein